MRTALVAAAAAALALAGCREAPPVSTPPHSPSPAPTAVHAEESPPRGDEALREVLTDLAAWDAATRDVRRRAAEFAAARAHQFRLQDLMTFSAGGQSHEIAVFEHRPTRLEFVLVPGGTFRMGSPAVEKHRDATESQRTVRLSQPFLLARTEVPQWAWQRVMEDHEASRYAGFDRPVESLVSWGTAMTFCKLARLELPTEAQWEYACRAGTTTAYAFGDEPSSLNGAANLADAYGGAHPEDFAYDVSNLTFTDEIDDGVATTAPVASYAPNAFGLFDMHGNVMEWCADWHADDLGTEDAVDPRGPSPDDATSMEAFGRTGKGRALRGGNWACPPAGVRSAGRHGGLPWMRADGIGFRPSKSIRLD